MASKPEIQLVLSRSGPGRITVDMEAFFEFSFWMAEELEDLVAKWAHTAAPQATRSPVASRKDLGTSNFKKKK